jgi:hypothetical protein
LPPGQPQNLLLEPGNYLGREVGVGLLRDIEGKGTAVCDTTESFLTIGCHWPIIEQYGDVDLKGVSDGQEVREAGVSLSVFDLKQPAFGYPGSLG